MSEKNTGWLRLSVCLASCSPVLGPRRVINGQTSSSQPRLRCRPHLDISLFFRGAGKLLRFHPAVNSETFFRNYILWPLGLENHNGFTAAILLLKKKMHVKSVFVEGSWWINIDAFCCIKKKRLFFSNSSHKSNVFGKTTLYVYSCSKQTWGEASHRASCKNKKKKSSF